MSDDLHAVIAAVMTRLPAWLRQDLSSSDATVRTRAEETLTAMLVEVIGRPETAS